MLGAALSAVAAAASSSTPPAAAAANGNLAPVAEDEAAAAAAAGSTNSKADQQRQQGNRRGQSPRQQRSSPVAIPGTAANGSEGVGSEGGSGGGVEAALSNFSNAVTGWGRNLLGAGVVDSLSTNEGIKALVTGRWGAGYRQEGASLHCSVAAAARACVGFGPHRAPRFKFVFIRSWLTTVLSAAAYEMANAVCCWCVFVTYVDPMHLAAVAAVLYVRFLVEAVR